MRRLLILSVVAAAAFGAVPAAGGSLILATGTLERPCLPETYALEFTGAFRVIDVPEFNGAEMSWRRENGTAIGNTTGKVYKYNLRSVGMEAFWDGEYFATGGFERIILKNDDERFVIVRNDEGAVECSPPGGA